MPAVRMAFAALTAALLGGVAALRAQTALYVAHDHEFCLVRRVDGHDPCIDDGTGKLVRVRSRDFALRKVPDYAPVYVAVRHLDVTIHSLRFVESSSDMNQRFEFRAEFESPYALKHVYVVLEFAGKDTGSALFVEEVGDLVGRKPKAIRIVANLNQQLAGSHYTLHLYSEGTELFHSLMPFDAIEQALDAMVRRRIANVVDAQPRPFTGPPPEYPARLWHEKVSGQAVIRFTISPTGRVLNPEVESATNPAFGDAALTAARMWRFLPRVKAGVALATPAEMPFAFEPPESKP